MSNGAIARGVSVLRTAGWISAVGALAFFGLLMLNTIDSRIDPIPFESAAITCGDHEVRVTVHDEIRREPSAGLNRVLYRLQSRASTRPEWQTVLEEWWDEPLENLEDRLRSRNGACVFFTPGTLMVRSSSGEWKNRFEEALIGAHVRLEDRWRHQILSVTISGTGEGELIVAELDGEAVRLGTIDCGATWRVIRK